MTDNQGNMSKNEMRIVRQVAENCLMDYHIIAIDEKQDYNAKRIGCEFAYQALLQRDFR